MSTLSFRCFVGRAGLADIWADWEVLAASRQGACFYHLPQWHAAYLDTLEADRVLEFHAAYQDGVLRAVFPLKRTMLHVGGITVRALVAPYDDHMPLTDFVSDASDQDRHYLLALLRHLRRAAPWDVVSFPRVPAESSAFKAVAHGFSRRLARIDRGGSDTVPLDEREQLTQRLSKNFRGNLRKARNKLQLSEGVDFVTARDVDALRAAYDDFLRVEGSGWKGRGGEATAIALHQSVRQFYLNLIERFGPSGACEINLLRVGTECISAQFCLVIGDVYYILKIGYDERYAALAPGNMLLEHLLGRLGAEGRLRTVNLVSDADWHDSWRPLRARVFEVVVANNTLQGLAAVLLLRARSKARRWAPPAAAAVRNLFAGMRRGVSELGTVRVTAART